MKKITLQELWEDYLPDIVSFAVDTDISKNTDQERPPEESCLKEILSNDVEIQYAVLSELAEQVAVHKHDPTTVCSFGSNIFAGSQTDKADYEKKLRGIFKVVSRLYDASADAGEHVLSLDKKGHFKAKGGVLYGKWLFAGGIGG